MVELISESFKVPNLPATILLLLILLYWVVNLIGIFDFEMLLGDADFGKDVEVDHDLDSDSFLGKTFDFGDVPIAIAASFFVLFFWMSTLLTNYYLGNSSLWFALIIYIPAIIGSFIITRLITIPLSKLYSLLHLHTEETDTNNDFTGSVCTLFVEASEDKSGQGEINRNGDPIRVHIRTYPGKVLKKGQSALLIEYFADKGYYIAEPYESIK